eukprot:12919029-Prorocentrum_lima.AAC.1
MALAVCYHLGSSMDQRANRNNTLPYPLTSLTFPTPQTPKERKEATAKKQHQFLRGSSSL